MKWIIAFCVNFKGCFLGKILSEHVGSEASLSGNISSFRGLVSHSWFIASPLLPMANEVLHFSGNNVVDKFIVQANNKGKALDALQNTIDAFTHFMIMEAMVQLYLLLLLKVMLVL